LNRRRAISVRPNQSAARVLEVLEAIAAHGPIGVSALARMLEADKMAAQRAIVTLAEAGWIAAAPGPGTRWKLTAHIFAVAYRAHGKDDLRSRAKQELEGLRDESGETAVLTVLDGRNFIVADIAASPHVLNASPSIGSLAPPRDSATARAVLPHLSRDRQIEILGCTPDAELVEAFEAARRLGYAVIVGGPMEGVTSIAAPIFEIDGGPVGAIVVAGPTERLSGDRRAKAVALVAAAGRNLSRAGPAGAGREALLS
jgi:DNA-binding IclR family transcriptional regulator